MSERDVFPHADDRRLIARFLDGLRAEPTAFLSTNGSALGRSDRATTFVWFERGDGLRAFVTAGSSQHLMLRTINHIAQELGIPERAMLAAGVGARDRLRQFVAFGDRLFEAGQVFEIAGPLTVAAYRARGAH
jgi:hypothetical protein